MELSDFTHVHVHSMYSILDGENRLEALVAKTKELGMKQIALTDHGTMMGSLNFYKACKKEGIKPIIGVEAYTTNDPDGLKKEDRTRDNFHLVLVAYNSTGYLNLLDLVSRAQLQNFYMKPRISKHNLNKQTTEGIIATSACLGNELNRMGNFDSTTRTFQNRENMERTIEFYKNIFDTRYFLEIQDNDDEAGQQAAFNSVAIDLAKQFNLKTVITSDAHYTTIESSKIHSVLMAMQLKKTYADYISSPEMKYGPWFYIRSPQEMLDAARKYNCEEAFWNACEIGNTCQLEIELGKYKTPIFAIESEPDYSEFLRSVHDNR